MPFFSSLPKSHATSPTHGHCGGEHCGHGLDMDISAIFLTVRISDQPLLIVYSLKVQQAHKAREMR